MDDVTHRKTILVVDDTPENIDVLSGVLRSDYEVKAALNGKDALKIAEADPIPDIILLDIMMPGMDGYAVCRHLKANPLTAKIPVIFVTAKTEKCDEEKGLTLGAVDYITKPFSPPIVKARVYTHLALYEESRKLGIKNRQLQQEVENRKRAEEMALQAKVVADDANRAKSIFLANMSHEIRTPMNAVLGFTDLLRSEPTISEEHRNWLDIISSSGNHLLALINDILDISKIEAGRTTLVPSDFNLKAMLGDLEDMFRVTADKKGLDLEFKEVSSIPDFINADVGKLRQILVNLLGNAIKFTFSGCIICRAYAKPTSKKEAAYQLTIEVQDTGPGIAKTERNKVFNTFEQTESGQKSEQGTGLGLAISRGYARLMGGDITLDSEVNVGTTFRLTLLVKNNQSNLSIEEEEQQQEIKGLKLGQPRKKLLMIDNEVNNRQLICEILKPMGFAVVEASDTKKGYALFVDEQPDLVLMDFHVHIGDTLEIDKILKAANHGALAPIIALTASGFEDECQIILDHGFSGFLRKPFKRAELLELIGQHLGLNYDYEGEESLVIE